MEELVESHSSVALLIVLADEVRGILEGASNSVEAAEVNDIVLGELSQRESVDSLEGLIGLVEGVLSKNDSLTLNIMFTISNSLKKFSEYSFSFER